MVLFKFTVSSSSSSSLIILSWSRKAIVVFTASFQSEFVSPYIDYRSVRSVPQAFFMYQTGGAQPSLILFLWPQYFWNEDISLSEQWGHYMGSCLDLKLISFGNTYCNQSILSLPFSTLLLSLRFSSSFLQTLLSVCVCDALIVMCVSLPTAFSPWPHVGKFAI